MTRDEIFTKYQNAHVVLGHTHTNDAIVGMEADENNQMQYVVRRNQTLVIEDFSTAQPKLTVFPAGLSVTVKEGRI